jgi:hypothetical protein
MPCPHHTAGQPPGWLKCPLVGHAFVLDLLESLLLTKHAVFQQQPDFQELLQGKVGLGVWCASGLRVS